MAFSIRNACSVATLALTLVGAPAFAQETATNNRSLGSVHEPVVSRTDYTIDLAQGPSGLAWGEAQRLSGWFEALRLGYSDTVSVAGPAPSREAVGAVLSRFGMLVSHDPAPVTAGQPEANAVRVVVSRAIARVVGCPNWAVGNQSDYANRQMSNYGCAAAQNLAAMIANPQDLVEGASAGPASSPDVSVKAIKSYRDAKNTGDAGLPGGVSSVSVGGK